MIDFVTPVAPDKCLGKEYNRAMADSKQPWVCIRDCDTAFLTPMDIVLQHMLEYIRIYPQCGLFTCLTNRVYNKHQLHEGHFSDETDIMHHIRIAQDRIKSGLAAPVSPNPLSGFLMLIKKELWKEVGGYREQGRILGTDNEFSEACRKAGSLPRVMHTIYLFHVYRLGMASRYDVSHLGK